MGEMFEISMKIQENRVEMTGMVEENGRMREILSLTLKSLAFNFFFLLFSLP